MASLPSYVAAAKPVPQANRVPWYKSTAQTYAGIMLWFVFWESLPAAGGRPGGTLADGLTMALCGLVLAALLCHFLYYLVPGTLGQKTGLPLYIVGTSTYGVLGGFIMPGFLMGLLQFGWLGVNTCKSAKLLCGPFYESLEATLHTPGHIVAVIVFAVLAAFLGLKGIRYVAKVATFLPLIPLAILIILCVQTVGGLAKFDERTATETARLAAIQEANDKAKKTADAVEEKKKSGTEEEIALAEKTAKEAAQAAASRPPASLATFGVVNILLIYVIGFFATAGAAGCDFGMNNRNSNDVQLGGLVGIAGATIFAGGLSLLIVAGALGLDKVATPFSMRTTDLMDPVMGKTASGVFWYLLAIAAFPPACFSAFIAANSFKTTLSGVHPFISVGLGTALSIVLAATGWADDVVSVFVIIGASFGPICGAMAADYLLSGGKWAGPRAGFNPAGWISWLVGFLVGAAEFVAKIPKISWLEDVTVLKHLEVLNKIPAPPLAAFVVGFVLYLVLAKLGLQSRTLEMPRAST
jgi:cytosine permease